MQLRQKKQSTTNTPMLRTITTRFRLFSPERRGRQFGIPKEKSTWISYPHTVQ